MIGQTIICSTCGEQKPKMAYYSGNKKCKKCCIEYQKNYSSKNKKKISEYARGYNKQNADTRKAYREANKDKIQAQKRADYLKSKEGDSKHKS